MQKNKDGQLIFSPTDLVHFLGSPFVTWMDRWRQEQQGGKYNDPIEPDQASETEKILAASGIAHEQAFLAQLIAEGRDVLDVSSSEDKFAATLEGMREGREIIYQGALRDDRFIGYSDFLVRTDGQSQWGCYHYEPWDTKLALSSKPYFLIQLACYADLLLAAQGVLPGRVHIVLGNKDVQSFRTADYLYYYRQLRQAMLAQQAGWSEDAPPDFLGLEDFGRWKGYAEKLMEQRDHLCRVANIRTVQIKKLYGAGIDTMTKLAASARPSVPRMQQSTFHTLRRQAQLQIESQGLACPKYEVIVPQIEGYGLSTLPDASSMDVYFDMEGYPLADDGGLEYLFGASVLESGQWKFVDWWAHDRQQEKRAFEDFIDWVCQRWDCDRTMHVYHYASYEKTALRKLMGRYGTREQQLDQLLRNELFVDLFTIVRQSIRVGEPNYSIKSIEHLYKGKRAGAVATAMDSVVAYQQWVDHKDGEDWRTSAVLRGIRDYNKEDCESTGQLADWLRRLRDEQKIKWTPPPKKEPPQTDSARERSAAAQLAEQMREQLPADEAQKTPAMRIQELLSYLLEFHWRESKPVFWAKYDRHEMTEEELFEDPGCLAGLVRTATPPQPVAQSYRYEYSFEPDQETKIDAGDSCFFAHDLEQTITVLDLDADRGIVGLKRGRAGNPPPDRLSLILSEHVSAQKIADSIFRTASAWMAGRPLPSALDDFLNRRRPRISGSPDGPVVPADAADLAAATTDVILRMEHSALCIQGPPGSGKTYTAALAIRALLESGKRVGISSNSHKAIVNLMEKVGSVMPSSIHYRPAKLQGRHDERPWSDARIVAIEPKKYFGNSGDFNLIGGTAWAFSEEHAAGLLDYLFVDEAGQVSLANLVGMAPSARNLVVIGDQMQLSQPLQGTHPGKSGNSILEYLLEEQEVIPDQLGIFLSTTYRMHPDVCSFISGAVYEDRLQADPQTAKRYLIPAIPGKTIVKRAGILFVPVDHEGNSQDSEEEATAIVDIVAELRRCRYFDGTSNALALAPGAEREGVPLNLEDILIVAPYNMQVRRLKNALPGARVGSVDKFQGQQAPVVIVSMCSSTGDASARGLEFIFSKNRLNVAISRAQVLAIVVGSRALARTHCNRIEQMELVNLFCRIVECGSPEPVLLHSGS